eukprot:Gregarina_sp_Poly_1__11201@NODE_918_length_5717_cov_156_805310_g653_i0_p2_GENE_NODE_918_length_5717_cov_156_805310_g653_i0NODE_918_length_5717_cov_156_805310_g653_i0_p2_ORF_typecomplete_len122_score14_15_NODE_918_length_5717_cov_156_805310_g653_i0548913
MFPETFLEFSTIAQPAPTITKKRHQHISSAEAPFRNTNQREIFDLCNVLISLGHCKILIQIPTVAPSRLKRCSSNVRSKCKTQKVDGSVSNDKMLASNLKYQSNGGFSFGSSEKYEYLAAR